MAIVKVPDVSQAVLRKQRLFSSVEQADTQSDDHRHLTEPPSLATQLSNLQEVGKHKNTPSQTSADLSSGPLLVGDTVPH